MTGMAFSSRRLRLSTSRVRCTMCKVSARFGPTLGPGCCGASAAMSDASRWRLQVLKDDDYTASRRSIEPASPGCVQRSAAVRMQRLPAFVKTRHLARPTTSMSSLIDAAGRTGQFVHCGHRGLGLKRAGHTDLVAH